MRRRKSVEENVIILFCFGLILVDISLTIFYLIVAFKPTGPLSPRMIRRFRPAKIVMKILK